MIATRHHSKDFGCKLEFDYDGKLISKATCAREQGTTVFVSQLFHTLPVRHKEFRRNIKKEFAKLSTILQAYGIISTGVRISCINHVEKKKNIILSTHGCNSMLENITNVFGPKQVWHFFYELKLSYLWHPRVQLQFNLVLQNERRTYQAMHLN